jgi:hypothetical protein
MLRLAIQAVGAVAVGPVRACAELARLEFALLPQGFARLGRLLRAGTARATEQAAREQKEDAKPVSPVHVEIVARRGVRSEPFLLLA